MSSRDANSKGYRRFLSALNNVARTRSAYFDNALQGSVTPDSEVTEYVADTWRKIVATGYGFKLGDRISQRTMELDTAAQLAFGTAPQKEMVFKAQLPEEIDGSELICKCIGASGAGQSTIERLESFELLAEIFFPGSKWATFAMIKALEDISHVVDSWGPLSVFERLASLRAQLRAGKQLTRLSKGALYSSDSADGSGGSIGVYGLQAIRFADFIDTRAKVKDLTDSGAADFTSVLDLLGKSKCKLWRAVGLGKLNKASGVIEIETVSKFTGGLGGEKIQIGNADLNRS